MSTCKAFFFADFRQRRRNIVSAAIAAALGAGSAAAIVLTGTAFAGERDTKVASSWCADRCDELVIDWNTTAYAVIKAENGYADPMAASRVLAMMHLAMHDAINSARPRFARHVSSETDRAADPAMAGVQAAHDVLAALFPKQQALLKAELDKTIVDAGKSPTVVLGVTLGKQVAAAALKARANDGSAAQVSFQEGTKPGEYRFTPGFNFAAAPQWRNVQPFTLKSPSQFRSVAPPPLTSVAYATDLNEVKAVGGKAGAKRSDDETSYGAFWYEFSDIGWNRIARVVARDQKQDLWQRARTFALLNAVMADAYIAGWDSKFHYNLWRPVTAIRAAETDGNASTSPDTNFEPMLPTPPVQDYPSTHSALGAAAATVLAQIHGDRTRFTFTSTSALPANPERTFRSFSEAARENADSRVKAGLHFRFATTAGLKLGEDIGRNAMRNSLTPLD